MVPDTLAGELGCNPCTPVPQTSKKHTISSWAGWCPRLVIHLGPARQLHMPAPALPGPTTRRLAQRAEALPVLVPVRLQTQKTCCIMLLYQDLSLHTC